MSVLSRYLANHRASPNSKSLVADLNSGKIIAAADREYGVQTIGERIAIATVEGTRDPDIKTADLTRTLNRKDNFLFKSPVNGEEISAAFTKFPGDFGKAWEIIILTPTRDFIGSLEATNRQMVYVIVGLIAVELLLIYALSMRLSRPIENISRELKSVEDLTFNSRATNVSKIKEIAQLQSATTLLRNSLQSFSSFVPLDVVRELIRTGTPLTLGVEQRFMTVLFTDIESFTSLSEDMSPNELLDQMSVYFERVSGAITQEFGTVDKFIGDGVMAFWGAPVERPDHALRACAAALRAARRMTEVNDQWEREGRPKLRVRIGLHSADVLVGNVGSTERLSYTVMGDGVNVAARLEGMNKVFGTKICVSDGVLAAAGTSLVVRPIREVHVKGRSHALIAYELMGIDGEDAEIAASEQDARLSRMTWDAWRQLQRGDVAKAAQIYRAILDAFPGDPVARSQLETCDVPQEDAASA
jgi:adenylate cyclase